MFQVPDLKLFLAGSWQVDRSLLDRRLSIRGEFHGQVSFTLLGTGLIYEERGTLSFGEHKGIAEQRYRYEFDCGNARAHVSFRDGRAFHELDLSRGQAFVSHTCGTDLYEGRFAALDLMQWRSAWTVSGPRKDQEIFTIFTRLN